MTGGTRANMGSRDGCWAGDKERNGVSGVQHLDILSHAGLGKCAFSNPDLAPPTDPAMEGRSIRASGKKTPRFGQGVGFPDAERLRHPVWHEGCHGSFDPRSGEQARHGDRLRWNTARCSNLGYRDGRFAGFAHGPPATNFLTALFQKGSSPTLKHCQKRYHEQANNTHDANDRRAR